MRLALEQAAQRLGIPTATLHRWARRGIVPAVISDGAITFAEKELADWAREHDFRLRSATENQPPAPVSPPEEPNLAEALRRGGILFDLLGTSPGEVLANAIDLAPLPPEVDRKQLLERLLEREKLASTGVGSQVALPHPRQPLERLERPLVIFARLAQPVDFSAVDGRPVRLIFLLLSPSTQVHLKLLARIGLLLRLPSTTERLLACSTAEQVLEIAAEGDAAAARAAD